MRGVAAAAASAPLTLGRRPAAKWSMSRWVLLGIVVAALACGMNSKGVRHGCCRDALLLLPCCDRKDF